MIGVTSYNHWPEAAVGLHKALARTVKKVTLDFQKDARSFAAVDTGFMRDSIYSTGAWGSDYGEATAHTAVSTKPKSQFKTQAYLTRDLLPEIAPPSDDLSAYIACATSYGVYVNYGTSRMGAQPFWEPALRIAEVNLDGQLALVEAQIKGAVVFGSVTGL